MHSLGSGGYRRRVSRSSKDMVVGFHAGETATVDRVSLTEPQSKHKAVGFCGIVAFATVERFYHRRDLSPTLFHSENDFYPTIEDPSAVERRRAKHRVRLTGGLSRWRYLTLRNDGLARQEAFQLGAKTHD